MGSNNRHILLLLLITARYASAQPPPSSDSRRDPYLQNAKFNPSMAIVIVILISALFFLGFFSIYIRKWAGDRLDARSTRGGGVGAAAAAARSRRQRGIKPEALAAFPTFVFSEVKAHKIGKSSLECAVCLCEFEDDETLRLLPKCDHVFHPDCIDAWLASHVTCPVCRCNLEEIDAPEAAVVSAQEPAVQETPAQVENEQVTIQVHDEEIENLERFINMKRSKSRAARPARFPRSHSTGHSLVLPGENLDRFTLRLPENVRRGVLERTTSSVAFPRERSLRRGYRREEGGTGRAVRSIQLGSSRSERWGSFLVRTLSVRNWGRRVDGDESSRGGGLFRRGESMKGERSMKGKRYRRGDSVKFEAQTSSTV